MFYSEPEPEHFLGAGAGTAEMFYSEPEPEPESTKHVTAPHPWMEPYCLSKYLEHMSKEMT